MGRLIAALFIFLGCLSTNAQYITQGPAIGAVTDTSCKMYLRTKQASLVSVELAKFPEFVNGVAYRGYTKQDFDNTVMLNIGGLEANTRYFYKIYVNGEEDTIRGNFRTFPASGQRGDYVFVTGSCQETENMKVFDVMPLHQPYFLMHTGDYTYPDYQMGPEYAATMQGVAKSYQRRYDEKVMKQMLHNIPVDYMHDDDDYVGGSGGRYCTNDFKAYVKDGRVVNEMFADTFDAVKRENVIKGYTQFFPHYDLPDTATGIFHSFKFGNAEFFVIDRESDKAWPNKDAFKYDPVKKKWRFDPPKGYALFGKNQMDWLKQAMKNSTADWKFIVSGVPLNGACKKLTNAGIKLQNMHIKGWYGFHLAWGFGQYWNAYPEERNDFMKFLKDNNINNVIVVSGDTHHSVMDDGKNAGLPEINASGLSVSTTELAKYLKLIGNITGFYSMKKIWNKGGIGLSSKICKNGFGKIRVVSNEFVELSIIDEDNTLVSSFKVPFKK
jgi:alkaline phosphatase D